VILLLLVSRLLSHYYYYYHYHHHYYHHHNHNHHHHHHHHSINERILQLRYKLQRGYLTLIALYAPEEGKLEQTEEFYETLQDQVNKINKTDYIIVAGDYNNNNNNNVYLSDGI
jgi:hypothetical protein